jgi:N-formylglutamate amidohydrolase
MTASLHLAPPPFVRLGPATARTPLVIAVPHAGRYYPASIERDRAVSRRSLEDLEDRYADRLVGPIVAAGAVAIVGTYGRAWIDLNRGPDDAGGPDAADASPRARAGLGLVPSRIGGRALWRSFPDAAEIDARIEDLHAPYHRAIDDAIEAALARHNAALLIDCHSMPPLGRSGRPGARIVIGDRHGMSVGSAIVEAAMAACARNGMQASRNAPYAGAFTIQHHGRPQEGVHAIQVEMDRSLYLREGLREPSDRIGMTASFFADLCQEMVNALPAPLSRAAE